VQRCPKAEGSEPKVTTGRQDTPSDHAETSERPNTSKKDDEGHTGAVQQGVFTHGSTMRHVVVMTATASVGLMAIFAVDLLNIFYISLLGEKELAAAIGYAGTVMFFAISICIGIAIAGTALVARALGAGDRALARQRATSSLIFMLITAIAFTIAALPLVEPILKLLGAEGRTLELGTRFLTIVLPSTPLLGAGMILAAFLRALGEARRAMFVTLSGGIAAAILDPLLIFGFGLGLDGAAIATNLSRIVLVVVGLYGVVHINNLLARPSLKTLGADLGPLGAIAGPAVLTNIATPVGNAFVTEAISDFGDSAVAGWAIVGRLIPFAFGAIFALSGAVGPIIGQNYGARQFDRIRSTMRDSFILTLGYTLAVWILLALSRDLIILVFGASEDAARLVTFFCLFVAGSFIFNGMLFVGNALFNNLGYPILSTVFNWGKALLGTIPFIWIGAALAGATGVLAGQAIGSVIFGLLAAAAVRRIITRCEHDDSPDSGDDQGPKTPVWRMAIPAFATGKGAIAGS
jgi:putative MATE family efflux protein